MDQDSVRHCPECGQALRFPQNVGGVLMACPGCGHRFASAFRLGTPAGKAAPAKQQAQAAAPPIEPSPTAVTADSQPDTPAAPTATPSRALAARVAAIYAAKAS